MSPFILWLFFTLDKIGNTSNTIMSLSITFLIITFIVWMIVCFTVSSDCGDVDYEAFWECSNNFYKRMKGWIILAITLLSTTILITTFLPKTKEAVAIVVIPKVLDYAKNNETLMKIPNNVLNMANTFMEKKISDWTNDIEKDSTKTSVDSTKTSVVIQDIKDIKKIVNELK